MQVASNLEKSEVASFYRQMLLIRRFEEAAGRLYMQGKIKGFLHLYIGQEAVAVGAIPTLGENDYVISHHRDHGHAITKGLDPKKAMAELMAKATGSSGGKAGSMHLFDTQNKFMGGHAIVAGQIPLATGAAFAFKYKEVDNVAVAYFGEAAVNNGAFHESLNMAALWNLPIVGQLRYPAVPIDGMVLVVEGNTMRAFRGREIR